MITDDELIDATQKVLDVEEYTSKHVDRSLDIVTTVRAWRDEEFWFGDNVKVVKTEVREMIGIAFDRTQRKMSVPKRVASDDFRREDGRKVMTLRIRAK